MNKGIGSIVALAGLILPGPARATSCEAAFAVPTQTDPGDAGTLYQAALAAMRADRMAEADHLLLSSYARIGEVATPADLEPQVMARLTEVAIQRGDLTTAMIRLKALQARLQSGAAHPAWVDAVVKYADGATIAEQDRAAGSGGSPGCRALGVGLRSAVRINFDTASAALDARAHDQLVQVAANLMASAPAHVVVRGHTDARGSDAYNDALSLQRAAAVVRMLVAIEPALAGRLEPRGLGKREPLYPGSDADSYRLNRRVEFVLSG